MSAGHHVSAEEAEAFTAGLGNVFSGGWQLIAYAQKQGIPEALGLTTPEWVRERLGGYVRMGIEERREAVAEMAAEGMSGPEIAAVVGVSDQTVYRDLSSDSTNVEVDKENPREDEGLQDVRSTFVESDTGPPLLPIVDLETGEVVDPEEEEGEAPNGVSRDVVEAGLQLSDDDDTRKLNHLLWAQSFDRAISRVVAIPGEWEVNDVASAIEDGQVVRLRMAVENLGRFVDRVEAARPKVMSMIQGGKP